MTDPRTPSRRTGELPPTEPIDRRKTGPTDPIEPRDPMPPPPPGGYANLSRRRRWPDLPGRWLVIAAIVLVVVFLLGFLVGRSQEPELASGERVEQNEPKGGQKGQAGGRKGRPRVRVACRRGLDLALQEIDIQRQALANRAQFAEALLAEDTERIAALNESLDPLLAQADQIQMELDQAVTRCRR